MEPLQPYLSWIADRFAEARALPADRLLLVIAGMLVIVFLLLRAWWKATRRTRIVQRNVAALEAELASARKVLQEEIKWRQSAERRGGPAPQPVVPDANPPSAPPDAVADRSEARR
jgi:hypothetical protein